jgi:hypothetical protein
LLGAVALFIAKTQLRERDINRRYYDR